MKSLSIVILAAGLGKRMKSNLPKALHPIGGKPMLAHVLDTARALDPDKLIVVYGHQGARLKEAFKDYADITWVEQKTFEGTGDAMRYAFPACLPDSHILMLCADTPFIDAKTLHALVAGADENTLSWLTVALDNPTGYGRIIRNQAQKVVAIVEEKDANPEQRLIREINSGVFCVPYSSMASSLPRLTNHNSQNEYYITDILAIACETGLAVTTTEGDPETIRGVNDRIQLAELEALYQQKQRQTLMHNGVSLIDPARTTLSATISHGTDCLIHPDVTLLGNVVLGDNVEIGVGSIIKNSTIGNNTTILPYSIIEGSVIGEKVSIGPFARLRENTTLEDQSRIGNFVETKNTLVGKGSKANHLTYLGDTQIGTQVNIGAGTITCNYDGANKHRTTIKDAAFIGSNTALVAPVTIGENATVAAGSVITAEVIKDALAITRAPQRTINNWKRPQKQHNKTEGEKQN